MTINSLEQLNDTNIHNFILKDMYHYGIYLYNRYNTIDDILSAYFNTLIDRNIITNKNINLNKFKQFLGQPTIDKFYEHLLNQPNEKNIKKLLSKYPKVIPFTTVIELYCSLTHANINEIASKLIKDIRLQNFISYEIENKIEQIINQFINENKPFNEIKRINLQPLINLFIKDCTNYISSTIINTAQYIHTVDGDEFWFTFRKYKMISIDDKLIEVLNIKTFFYRELLLAYTQLAKQSIKSIRTLNTYDDITGQEVLVSGMGASRRDYAIVDYDGELLKGKPPLHHRDIQNNFAEINNNFDINKINGYAEAYNDIALIVAPGNAPISTLKNDLLKEYSKVYTYADDSLTDGSDINKIVRAKRLFQKVKK